MAALDTNILVRYLVQDDNEQLTAVTQLFRQTLDQGQALFVPVTVALELEWVLRSRYKFEKSAVMQALSDLLATTELSFEAELALEVALALYRTSSADFADCLHVALAHEAGQAPLWTFDGKVRRQK